MASPQLHYTTFIWSLSQILFISYHPNLRTMSKITFVTLFFFAFASVNAQLSCDEAYSAAGYAYQHTKKALEANNDSHLKYYAERAIESLTTVNTNALNCGCKEAEQASFDAIEYLKKTLETEGFEPSRYFVKKAKPLSQHTIDALDVCMSSEASSYSELVTGSETLEEEEEMLRIKQQRLIEEQRKLEAKLAEKKRLHEELKRQKQQELTQQLAVKDRIEPAMLALENAYSNLVSALGCEEGYEYLQGYKRELQELEKESLNATEQHYVLESTELLRKLVAQLERCKGESTAEGEK